MSSSPWSMKRTLQELPDSTFVPRRGDVHSINSLPVELLSRIFQVGTWSYDSNRERDRTVDAGDVLRELDVQRANEMDDSDAEAVGEEFEEEEEPTGDDGDEGDEEWADDEEEGEGGTDDETYSDDSTTFFSFNVPQSPSPFEIVVSHVCRHWRSVALSTPSLWTTIEVSPDAEPPYTRELILLQRSKSLPIDICINTNVFHEEVTPDAHLVSLFALFVPHVCRWRTMRFPIIKYHHMHELLSALSGPSIPVASRLTTLQLYALGGAFDFDSATFTNPEMSKHFTIFGGSAPRLTRLVLWGVHINWSQPWVVSASSLTELELSFHAEAVRPTWTQFAAILRGASALERLTLSGSGPSGDPDQWFVASTLGSPPDPDSPIELPRVTKLVIGYYPQTRAMGLIRKLRFPALKHLSLCFDGEDYTDFSRELAAPAHGQSQSLFSKLESLKIKRLPCDVGCIDTLYAQLEKLTSLNISISPPSLSRFFLDLLATPGRLTGHGRVWLPRLVTLCVSGATGDDLREVVKKRRDAGVPLSSLYVQKSKEVNYEDVVWLVENVKTLKFFEMDMD